jgi:hypothetical protein
LDINQRCPSAIPLHVETIAGHPHKNSIFLHLESIHGGIRNEAGVIDLDRSCEDIPYLD